MAQRVATARPAIPTSRVCAGLERESNRSKIGNVGVLTPDGRNPTRPVRSAASGELARAAMQHLDAHLNICLPHGSACGRGKAAACNNFGNDQ